MLKNTNISQKTGLSIEQFEDKVFPPEFRGAEKLCKETTTKILQNIEDSIPIFIKCFDIYKKNGLEEAFIHVFFIKKSLQMLESQLKEHE